MTPWSIAPPPQNVHDAIDQAVDCTLAAVIGAWNRPFCSVTYANTRRVHASSTAPLSCA